MAKAVDFGLKVNKFELQSLSVLWASLSDGFAQSAGAAEYTDCIFADG